MDRRVKVLTVGSDSKVKGGITSVITQILNNNWEKYGIQMNFIPTYIDGNIIKKVVYFFFHYLKIRQYLENQKPTVVHIHMSQGGSFERKKMIVNLCRKQNVKCIIHLHSSSFMDFYNHSSKRKKQIIKHFLCCCDEIVALGDEWDNRIHSIAPDAKVLVLNNAVTIPPTTIKIDSDIVQFLYLGVLIERKGVYDLLKAIACLKENGFFKSYKVLFNIGGSGDQENVLKKYVLEKRLQNYVNFLGWVVGDQKIDQLKRNQVFVLPSYNEGLPIAILEAISYGMPVISTNVGSVEEAVKKEFNGFIVHPGDIEGLKNAIMKIVENKDLRKKMSLNSRKLAISNFDDILYYKKLGDLYKSFSEN